MTTEDQEYDDIQGVAGVSDNWTIQQGDCLDTLVTLPDACIDSVVQDPPAGIGFMGKEWDQDKGGRTAWVAWFTKVDCFAGSGSTGCAAVLEGFQFIGLEQDEEYCTIARQRILHWEEKSNDQT